MPQTLKVGVALSVPLCLASGILKTLPVGSLKTVVNCIVFRGQSLAQITKISGWATL